MSQQALPEFQSVLVPLDGTERSRSAVPYVQALASRLGATVLLLAVVEPELPPTDDDEGRAQQGRKHAANVEAARRDLEAVQQRMAAHGLEVSLEVVSGLAAEAIVEVADRENVSVICMATHARGALGRVLRGSVADEVMRHSDIPILLLRQPSQH